MESQPITYRRIGNIDQLEENCPALMFKIGSGPFDRGFVIRFREKLYAYRNRCPHTGGNLDWMPGDVFDESGEYLVCATHGAIFDPATGICISGPCKNQRLSAIALKLQDGEIFVDLPPSDADSVRQP